MSSKKSNKSQVTNPTIPQAATILNAASKGKKKGKNDAEGTEGLNDSTQCTI